MKTFVLEESFPCSVLEYFRIIYELPDFKQSFHVDRGDMDVEVSEWIEQGPNSNSHQRICFYSTVEKKSGSNPPEVSRCLETERYEWQKDQNAEAMVLQVYNSITPENAMGNIFKITANWMVSPISASECKVWLEAQVECTKRVWGLQNIAEGYLYSMVSDSMKAWFKKGKQRVTNAKKEKQESDENKDDTSGSEDEGNLKAAHIRMRAIGEMNTEVSGTGKLAQMLNQKVVDADGNELDEEAMQGDNYLAHFVVESPHLHADDDLDEDGHPVFGKIRIPTSWLFALLFITMVVSLVYLYVNHTVII